MAPPWESLSCTVAKRGPLVVSSLNHSCHILCPISGILPQDPLSKFPCLEKTWVVVIYTLVRINLPVNLPHLSYSKLFFFSNLLPAKGIISLFCVWGEGMNMGVCKGSFFGPFELCF